MCSQVGTDVFQVDQILQPSFFEICKTKKLFLTFTADYSTCILNIKCTFQNKDNKIEQ